MKHAAKPKHEIKTRKRWHRAPWQRPHSTAKGGKGYSRKETSRQWQKEMRHEMS